MLLISGVNRDDGDKRPTSPAPLQEPLDVPAVFLETGPAKRIQEVGDGGLLASSAGILCDRRYRVPKSWSQKRLTATRAVRGWLVAISHWAKPRRLRPRLGEAAASERGQRHDLPSHRRAGRFGFFFKRNAGFGSPAFSRSGSARDLLVEPPASLLRLVFELLPAEVWTTAAGLGVTIADEVGAQPRLVWASVRFDRSEPR